MRERRGGAPRAGSPSFPFIVEEQTQETFINRAQTNYTRNNRNFQGELGRKNQTLHVQLNSFFNFIL